MMIWSNSDESELYRPKFLDVPNLTRDICAWFSLCQLYFVIWIVYRRSSSY